MEVTLILIAGILMGAINVGFFLMGYNFHKTKETENAVVLNSKNKEAIKDMVEWMNYHH